MKQSFRIGGIAFIFAGGIYIALLVLVAVIAEARMPGTEKDMLNLVAAQGLKVSLVMVLFIIKDLSVLFAFPVLALSLSKINKSKPWLGVAIIFASVAMLLDIISSLMVIAMRPFSEMYLSASDAVKQIYLINSKIFYQYIWNVETPFEVLLLSIAALIFSIFMRQSFFGKKIAYLGITLGVIGIIGGLLGLIQVILLLSVWYILVGLKLFHLAKVSND